MGFIVKILWLLFTASLLFFGEADGYPEAVAQINTKRLQKIVSERFLSLTIDPANLLSALPLEPQALNMLSALTPLFLRIGGPNTNQIKFSHTYSRDNYTITELQWSSLNEFAMQTGLNLIVSLNTMERLHGIWDTKNSLELISFSNKMGYDIIWQLGYNTGSFGGASGSEMGRDAVRLRMILEGLATYAGSPILGPDFILGQDDPQFIREFIHASANTIAAFSLQTKAARSEEDDVIRTLSTSQPEIYNMLLGSLSNSGANAPRKPVWIAEYNPSGGEMNEALSWIRRLGTAAKAGYQVVMRQPYPFSLISPTPDFWVSLLYKALVGREVLDTKLITANRTRVHVFSHCTRSTSNRNSILDKMWHYQKGAVTVFGVNMGRDHVKLVMRASLKEEPLHIYMMTSSEFGRSIPAPVYLNGQLLSLSPNGELPLVSPKVRKPTRSLNVVIHPQSAFFIVMPEAKSRACSTDPTPRSHELEELAKKLGFEPRERNLDVDPPAANDESDYDTDSEPVYVNFPGRQTFRDPSNQAEKLNERTSTLANRHGDGPVNIDDSPKEDSGTVSVGKYFTFNDNDWFRSFTDYLKPAQPSLQDHQKRNVTDAHRRTKRSVSEYHSIPGDVPTVKRQVLEILNLIEKIKPSSEPSPKDHSSEGTAFFPGLLDIVRKKRNASETLLDSRPKEVSENEQIKLCLENLTYEGEKLVETLESELLRSPVVNPCGALLKDITQTTFNKLIDENQKSKYASNNQVLTETQFKSNKDVNNHIDETQGIEDNQNLNDSIIQMNREIISFIMDLKFDPENEKVDTEGNRVERVLKEILRRTSDTELAKLTGRVTEEHLKHLVARNIGHGLSEEGTMIDKKVTEESSSDLKQYVTRDNTSNEKAIVRNDQITLTTLNPNPTETVNERETIVNSQLTESAEIKNAVEFITSSLPPIEQNIEAYSSESWKNIPLEIGTENYYKDENGQKDVLNGLYVVQPDRMTDESTNNRERVPEITTIPYSVNIHAIKEQDKLPNDITKWINARKRLLMNPDTKNEVSKETINESARKEEYFAASDSITTVDLEQNYQQHPPIQQNNESPAHSYQSQHLDKEFNDDLNLKVAEYPSTIDTTEIQELQGEPNMAESEVTDTAGVMLKNQRLMELTENKLESKLSLLKNLNIVQGPLIPSGFKTSSYGLSDLKGNNIKDRIEAFKQRLADAREKLRNAKNRNERQSTLNLYTDNKLGIPSILSDSRFVTKPRHKRLTFITEQESPFEDEKMEELIEERMQQTNNKRKKYLIPIDGGSRKRLLNNKLYASKHHSSVEKEDQDYEDNQYIRLPLISYEDNDGSLMYNMRENVPTQIEMSFKPSDYSLPRDENVFPLIILDNTSHSTKNKRSIVNGKSPDKYIGDGINLQNDELVMNMITVGSDKDYSEKVYSDKEDDVKTMVKNLIKGKGADLYEMAKLYTKLSDSSGFGPLNELENQLDNVQEERLQTKVSGEYETDEEWLASAERILLSTKETKQPQKIIDKIPQQSLFSVVFDNLMNVLDILHEVIGI